LRRLNRRRFNHRGQIVLDLEDTISLLTFGRNEKFEGERAICLFQFVTWILFPDTQRNRYAEWAAMISAVKYLDRIEENYFAAEEDVRLRDRDETPVVNLNDKPDQTIRIIESFKRKNATYRQLYDRFIGRRGGTLELLYTPSPTDFDEAIRSRIKQLDIIANLVEYRLRCAQHMEALPRADHSSDLLNSSHAMFFYWWPTHTIKGVRGKTPTNKSVSPRTMGTWWKQTEDSAIFLYLTQRHYFDQQIPTETADDFFIDGIIRASEKKSDLTRFFGMYAYVVDTLKQADCDLLYVKVPKEIPRIPVKTSPFTAQELKTISQYPQHYMTMRDRD
jgi:hypothetical protein